MVRYNLRSNARVAGLGILCAIIGGILPDAVSHGVILAGREGHFELAVLGAFLVLSGLFWYGLSITLLRRLPSLGRRTVEVVDNGL